jgi:adenylate cyclase
MELSGALIAGLLMIILVPLIGVWWTLGLLVVLLGGLGGGSWYLFDQVLMLVDVTYPGFSTLAMWAMVTVTSFSAEAAQKRQVRNAFGHYLSPALVEQLADAPDQLHLGGEMKDMTLLFADIRGFTTISEQFKKDPEGLTALINRLLTPMTNMILSRRGTIDKYMGDCIMAFWNASLDDDDHVRNACTSALAMFEAYRGKNWAAAREAIGRCRNVDGAVEGLYQLYEERIKAYEQEPPGADWDGVFVATSK